MGMHQVVDESNKFTWRRRMQMKKIVAILGILLVAGVAACAKKLPPVAKPTTPPLANTSGDANRPPAPPTPVNEPTPVPIDPAGADALSTSDLDAINKNS